jgi:RNA-directed DNA polymerase
MKRKNVLYENMISYNNILSVYKKIKNSTKNKKEVYNYELNLNQNLLDTLFSLSKSTYVFSNYNIFLVREPKYRLIMSESFPDKVVNHLFSKYVLSYALQSTLINSNVATRKDKGSKEAYRLFIKYTNKLIYEKKKNYVLKIDISKYFYNINHNILMNMVSEKIKDERVLNMLKVILDTTDNDYINKTILSVVNREIYKVNKLNISTSEKEKLINELKSIPLYRKGYGLPIGNMSSQILAVFFLNKVDHFIKEKLGCKYYIRYMDDLVILGNDKEELKNIFESVSKYIESFDLNVNKKSGIYSLSNSVNFLGYNFKVFNNKLIIRYRSDTIKRVNKRLKNLKVYDNEMYLKSVASYKGYFLLCNTIVRDKYISEI